MGIHYLSLFRRRFTVLVNTTCFPVILSAIHVFTFDFLPLSSPSTVRYIFLKASRTKCFNDFLCNTFSSPPVPSGIHKLMHDWSYAFQAISIDILLFFPASLPKPSKTFFIWALLSDTSLLILNIYPLAAPMVSICGVSLSFIVPCIKIYIDAGPISMFILIKCSQLAQFRFLHFATWCWKFERELLLKLQCLPLQIHLQWVRFQALYHDWQWGW